MKKIFAIALALVMVFSMASAFAAFCVNPDWSCAADVCTLGKAKVEVVPYVVANACDGKALEYVQSDCAAAVYGQKIFYAIKLTVPADINAEWFANATLAVKEEGLKDSTFDALAASHPVLGAIESDDDFGEKEMVWYVYNVEGDGLATWFVKNAADEDFDLSAVIMNAEVDNAKKAKVCAILASELPSLKNIKVGDYTVYYMGDHINVQNGKTGDDYKSANFFLNADKKIEYVTYVVGSKTYTFNYDDGASFLSHDATGVAKGYACAPFDWLKTVMNNFKFDFRTTCYTEKAFKANFGWDDEVKSCATYSANATAVVDTECVVAIPKTGDASVLAWLF